MTTLDPRTRLAAVEVLLTDPEKLKMDRLAPRALPAE
jgi:hypothetical protein